MSDHSDAPSTASSETPAFSFDAETDGLWGRAFAIGAVAVRDGLRAEFFAMLHPSVVREPWVREHVLPALSDYSPTHGTYDAMMRDFAAFYLKHKEGAAVITHMPVPVEARLLIDMRSMDLIGDWDGPFPLIDVAGLLQSVGADPTSVDAFLSERGFKPVEHLSPHHPLYDAEAALLAYRIIRETARHTNQPDPTQ